MSLVDEILPRLADLIRQDRYAQLETDALEIKPVPHDKGSWNERYKTVNAFMNARGGVVILGVEEIGKDKDKRYRFTGWHENAEPKLKELHTYFTDREGRQIERIDCPLEFRPFLDGQVAVLYVDELPAEQKYAFFQGKAYKRRGTGDHTLTEAEISEQEEYKQEVWQARELQPVPDTTPQMLDLDRLNDYITQLNKLVKIETIKTDLPSALDFLERKRFIRDGQVTTLGMLVCGRHPADLLEFRCHVHGYVEGLNEIAADKQDFIDNILPLMQNAFSYLMRNIHVGVSSERGGTSTPQYPEELIRETVNNALAHRDYAINRQVIVMVKPGQHIAIQNPGRFQPHLLIEEDAPQSVPIRRIIPEAKPRNPRLADVLRVYRKWEGLGIGMATLVNLSLQNRMDLPYYRFKTEEVSLFVCAGRLVDDRMERHFQSFDRYIQNKLQGYPLSDQQKCVLAYLIKSERANGNHCYTILLTPDNNHFNELQSLEQAGLIYRYPRRPATYPVYLVDPVLTKSSYVCELRELFGPEWDDLTPRLKDILNMIYRFNRYSSTPVAKAKRTSLALWHEMEGDKKDVEAFDTFYREVRRGFNKLTDKGFVVRSGQTRGWGYLLNEQYRQTHLL